MFSEKKDNEFCPFDFTCDQCWNISTAQISKVSKKLSRAKLSALQWILAFRRRVKTQHFGTQRTEEKSRHSHTLKSVSLSTTCVRDKTHHLRPGHLPFELCACPGHIHFDQFALKYIRTSSSNLKCHLPLVGEP